MVSTGGSPRGAMMEADTANVYTSCHLYADGHYLDVLRTRNTFLEPIEAPNSEVCGRRASSDPTSASGSSTAPEVQLRDAGLPGVPAAPPGRQRCTAGAKEDSSSVDASTAPQGSPSTGGKPSCRTSCSPIEPSALGELPSQGSAQHASGTCRPCLFSSAGRCAHHSSCRFCHYPHEVRTSRPGKEKRRRAQKLVDTLEARCQTTSDLSELAKTIESQYARNILVTKVKRRQGLGGSLG